MNGIRVHLDLSAFFNDVRKFSRVYVAYHECLVVKDVEEHIKKTFSIDETIVLISDKYLLPSSQSVNILQPSELVTVVRGDTVLNSENPGPCLVNGNNSNESQYVHSTPFCSSRKHKYEDSELHSSFSKKKRNAFEVDINSSSEHKDKKKLYKKEKQKLKEIEALRNSENDDHNSKKKLKEKENIGNEKCENESLTKPHCLPTDIVGLEQNGPNVVQDDKISYSKKVTNKTGNVTRKCTETKLNAPINETFSVDEAENKHKVENDSAVESISNIPAKLSTLSDSCEGRTKHKKHKKIGKVANNESIGSIQVNLSSLSDLYKNETSYIKKTEGDINRDGNQKTVNRSIVSEDSETEIECNRKKTNSEGSSDQTTVNVDVEAETNKIKLSSISATDTSNCHNVTHEMVTHYTKKPRKRIRKRKRKHLTIESAKMLYEKVAAVSKEMITGAKDLKTEIKQNQHIFFDEDDTNGLEDNILYKVRNKAPPITKILQTSNHNMTASGDSHSVQNILPPAQASEHDITVNPLNTQHETPNSNGIHEETELPPAQRIAHDNAESQDIATDKHDSAEIKKENGKGIDRSIQLKEDVQKSAYDNLVTLINSSKEKQLVFERRRKPRNSQEDVEQLPLVKNTNDIDVEGNKIRTSSVPDGFTNGHALPCTSKETHETRESEVQKVVPSFPEIDVKLYPIVDKFNPGDTIIFRTLKLNKSYEPVVSAYIFGTVVEDIRENGSLKVEILRGLNEFEGLPPGKFSLDLLDEEENSDNHGKKTASTHEKNPGSHIKEIERSCIIEPRLVYP